MQGIHQRKYGVEAIIPFVVYDPDGIDINVTWTPAAADCSVNKNGGGDVQCTNTAADVGASFTITLTSTEMEAARIVVTIIDAATKVILDDVLIIETYGDASAEHAFDRDTAFGATDIVSSGAITTSGGVVSTVGTVSGSVDSVTGDTKQTADVAALITTVGVAGLGLADLGGMSTGMKAEVNAECDGALDEAIPEITQGVPSATPSIRTGLMLMYMPLRNNLGTATSGADILAVYNDAGVVIAKKPLADDTQDYLESKMVSGP